MNTDKYITQFKESDAGNVCRVVLTGEEEKMVLSRMRQSIEAACQKAREQGYQEGNSAGREEEAVACDKHVQMAESQLRAAWVKAISVLPEKTIKKWHAGATVHEKVGYNTALRDVLALLKKDTTNI